MIAPKGEKPPTPSRGQKIEEILAILGDLYERSMARSEQVPPGVVPSAQEVRYVAPAVLRPQWPPR